MLGLTLSSPRIEAPFAAASGIRWDISPETWAQLGVLAEAAPDPRSTLELPVALGGLGEDYKALFVPDPALGRFKYDWNLTHHYRRAPGPQQFAAVAKKITSQATQWIFENDGFRDPVLTQARAAHVRKQNPLIADILGLDYARYGGKAVDIDFNFDHDLPAPGRVKNPCWHQDAVEELWRVYVIRFSVTPDIIRETAALTGRNPHPLIAGLAAKPALRGAKHEALEKELRKAGLIVRPENNQVVLISGKTWHRSHCPEPDEPQEPSAFVALAVRPLVPS